MSKYRDYTPDLQPMCQPGIHSMRTIVRFVATLTLLAILSVVGYLIQLQVLAYGPLDTRPVIALRSVLVSVALLLAWLAWRSQRIEGEARSLIGVAHGALRDRQISEALSSTRELLFSTDPNGVLNYVSSGWSTLTTKSLKEIIGKSLADVVAPASRQTISGLFVPASPRPTVKRAKISVLTQLLGARTLDVTILPVVRSATTTGYVGSAIDITSLVRAQAELDAQLRFGTSLIENSPLPTAVTDAQNQLVRVNRAWEGYTGLRGADVLGERINIVWPELRLPPISDGEREILSKGGVVQSELFYVRPDGAQRDLFVSQSALPSPGSKDFGSVLVFMDVTQFREAERQTRSAKEKAEAISHAKSEFIANISHELRTPLQSVLGFSELAIARGLKGHAVIDVLRDVHSAGKRMLVLVDDLLDLFKLEGAVGGMHVERHDVRQLLREVTHEVLPQLVAKSLDLKLVLPLNPVVAKVDQFRFQQVIRNVLANAIRFSPDRSTILVKAKVTSDGGAEVCVGDQGPGIPPTELDAIFDAFVQSSDSKSGDPGTGLGLAISRKIMELHGGYIVAENRPGGGALLRMRMPGAQFGDTVPASLQS